MGAKEGEKGRKKERETEQARVWTKGREREVKKCQIREKHAHRIFVNLVSYVRLESCGETSNCPNCRFYIRRRLQRARRCVVHRGTDSHAFTSILTYIYDTLHTHLAHTYTHTYIYIYIYTVYVPASTSLTRYTYILTYEHARASFDAFRGAHAQKTFSRTRSRWHGEGESLCALKKVFSEIFSSLSQDFTDFSANFLICILQV